MSTTLSIALKEWAVVTKQLVEGRQILLLRKGGIAEEGRTFRVHHDTFWLYPSFDHQKEELLKPLFHHDLHQVLATHQSGVVAIPAYARVRKIIRCKDADSVGRLRDQHCWSEEYVAMRLAYKSKEPIYVMLLRVYASPVAEIVTERPEYAGCKSWVPLVETLSMVGAAPVLSDEAFAAHVLSVERALGAGAADEIVPEDVSEESLARLEAVR